VLEGGLLAIYIWRDYSCKIDPRNGLDRSRRQSFAPVFVSKRMILDPDNLGISFLKIYAILIVMCMLVYGAVMLLDRL